MLSDGTDTLLEPELNAEHDRSLNPDATNAPAADDILDVAELSSPRRITSPTDSHGHLRSASSVHSSAVRAAPDVLFVRDADGAVQRLSEAEAAAYASERSFSSRRRAAHRANDPDSLVFPTADEADEFDVEPTAAPSTTSQLDAKSPSSIPPEAAAVTDFAAKKIENEKLDRSHDIENCYEIDPESGLKIVTWSGIRDPDLPYNWSLTRRWLYYLSITIACLACTASSSCYAAAVPAMMVEYHASRVAVLVGMTVYVLGFALGPMFFSPLSEIYGRRLVYRISLPLFCAFTLGSALSQTLAQQIIFRFLGGCCCSAIITVSGGTVVDLFPFEKRGFPMCLFSTSTLMGPVIGPIYSSYIAVNTSWRWIIWVIFIWSCATSFIVTVVVPETYGNAILETRAKKLRKQTGDETFVSRERITRLPVLTTLRTTLKRPFILLFREPIVLLTAIYISCVYGILYLFFEAYPFVFQDVLKLSSTNTSLMFIAVGVGISFAVITYPLQHKAYLAHRLPDGRIPPEGRLPFAAISGVLFPAALFWFAGASHAFWVAPALAGILFGFCICMSFQTILTYLVETYPLFAASVLASNGFLRSIIASVFPLFATQMLQGMGSYWGISLLGFVMLALAPVPFLFWKYGKKIRSKSHFARSDI